MNRESAPADPIVPFHQQYVRAVMAGDVAALLSLYTDAAVWMPPNEPTLFGKGELLEWYQEYFADFRVVSFGETEREVTVMGDWAIERWAYMVAIEPLNGDDRIRDDGRFLAIWQRDGDVWCMAQAMFNSIRPIGSGTSRFFSRIKKSPKG